MLHLLVVGRLPSVGGGGGGTGWLIASELPAALATVVPRLGVSRGSAAICRFLSLESACTGIGLASCMDGPSAATLPPLESSNDCSD